ncbi:MauE/DoxX family redox-associated membrane protein [Sphingobacterium thalpophilum]|uniref:MauE/DoxX family redox-associated membrane protein n=1 Tax=Sphingobacterium thalpophilum TaxID=259 RepID=UPI0024A6AC83|nr:MauE/DoxX family redox-associated membrane protein [Sphingobacterium thalpophilum]
MKKHLLYLIVFIIQIGLFALFMISVYQKIKNFETFMDTLIGTNLFYVNSVKYFAMAVIIAELAIAFFLLAYRKIGFYLTILLFVVYTLYIIIIELYYFYPSCGCGGIMAQLPFKEHLTLNLIYIILAAISVLFVKRSAYEKNIVIV